MKWFIWLSIGNRISLEQALLKNPYKVKILEYLNVAKKLPDKSLNLNQKLTLFMTFLRYSLHFQVLLCEFENFKNYPFVHMT